MHHRSVRFRQVQRRDRDRTVRSSVARNLCRAESRRPAHRSVQIRDRCSATISAEQFSLRFVREEVGILSCIGKAEENRTRFSDEEIADSVARENIADLFGLPVLECRGHLSSVSEPLRQIRFAPRAIVGHRVEGAKLSIIENRLVCSDECVLDALRQRAARGRFELFQPFLARRCCRLVHVAIVAWPQCRNIGMPITSATFGR